MKEIKPLISKGWIRAILYLLLLIPVTIFMQLSGEALIETIPAKSNIDGNEEAMLVIYVVITIGTVILTWLFRKFIDGKSFSSIGLQWKYHSVYAWIGFFTAIGILGIGTLALYYTGNLKLFPSFLIIPKFIVALLFMGLVAFNEELITRGYLLNNLMESTNRWIALGITATIFTAFHAGNPGISTLALINIFLAGLLLGINYVFTKNLWFAIFFHFAWNFTQGPLLGFEVSGVETHSLLKQLLTGNEIITGGRFGFEGSIICTGLLLVSIFFWYVLFNKKFNDKLISEIQTGYSENEVAQTPY